MADKYTIGDRVVWQMTGEVGTVTDIAWLPEDDQLFTVVIDGCNFALSGDELDILESRGI